MPKEKEFLQKNRKKKMGNEKKTLRKKIWVNGKEKGQKKSFNETSRAEIFFGRRRRTIAKRPGDRVHWIQSFALRDHPAR